LMSPRGKLKSHRRLGLQPVLWGEIDQIRHPGPASGSVKGSTAGGASEGPTADRYHGHGAIASVQGQQYPGSRNCV